MKVKLLLILVAVGFISCKNNQSANSWSKIFENNNINGTFVLKNLKSQRTFIYNNKRSSKKYIPASTFKILNSMIALQEKSIISVNDTIKWDGVDKGYKLWNKDQTMYTAFPISCVWFYQELARRTGQEKMQKWLVKSDYGNRIIKNKVDNFWLEGKLAISANEQVAFLEKLINNELPFDKNIQETVKTIMITDSSESYTIHSKTGWSGGIGWNVGYIEKDDDVWVFALNIDMNDIKKSKLRKTITYEILKEEKIIE